MTLYEQLDQIFPGHFYFYSVSAVDMSEALEKCARVIGENAHVINLNGQMYMASQTNLGSEITWAVPVAGNPTE